MTIGKIRNDNAVYKDGNFELLLLLPELLIFKRSKGQYSYVTVINNSENTLEYKEGTPLIGKERIVGSLEGEIIKIKRNTSLTFSKRNQQ